MKNTMLLSKCTLSSLSLILALGLGTSAAFAQPGPPQATSLHIYTPLQPDGGLIAGVATTGTARGTCFATSVATSARPDAYRCSSGNAILDPCFASLNDQAPLACTRDPWNANLTVLTLSKALPSTNQPLSTDPDYARSQPWALELTNGQRCTLMTGATAPIAGLRINYGCPDGGVVVGGIDRSLPLWQVFYQLPTRSPALSQVSVNAAWY